MTNLFLTRRKRFSSLTTSAIFSISFFNTECSTADDNHVTTANSGKKTLHIYVDEGLKMKGECVVQKVRGVNVYQEHLSVGEYPLPKISSRPSEGEGGDG